MNTVSSNTFQEPSQTTPPSGDNKSTTRKKGKLIKRIFIVFTVVLVLGVATAIGLIVAGKLTVSWGGEKVQVASTRIVCDDPVVKEYNRAAMYQIEADDSVPTRDSAAVAKLVEDVRGREGYQDDPTCQTILFWEAINDNNYAEGKNILATLQSLHDKHLYPDNNLYNAQGFSGYSSGLESINPEKSQPAPGRN
jgi:hypothetical protein